MERSSVAKPKLENDDVESRDYLGVLVVGRRGVDREKGNGPEGRISRKERTAEASVGSPRASWRPREREKTSHATVLPKSNEIKGASDFLSEVGIGFHSLSIFLMQIHRSFARAS